MPSAADTPSHRCGDPGRPGRLCAHPAAACRRREGGRGRCQAPRILLYTCASTLLAPPRRCPSLVAPLVSPATALPRSYRRGAALRSELVRSRVRQAGACARGGECALEEEERRGLGESESPGVAKGRPKPAVALLLPRQPVLEVAAPPGAQRGGARAAAPAANFSGCESRRGARSVVKASRTRCQVSDCRPRGEGRALPASGLSFPRGSPCRCPESLSRFRVGWGGKGAGWGRSEKFLPDPGRRADFTGAAGSVPARAQVGWARASAQRPSSGAVWGRAGREGNGGKGERRGGLREYPRHYFPHFPASRLRAPG